MASGGSNSSSPQSPLPSQWLSVEELLNSSTGKDLFLEYLRNEDKGLSWPMLFLLAVEGMYRVADETDEEKMVSSINLIYEKMLPSISCLSSRVTEKIQHEISTPEVTIFDEALDEIREYLSKDLYPNFLKSDFYLTAVRKEHGCGEPEPTVSPTMNETQSGTFEAQGPRNYILDQAGSSRSQSQRFRDLPTVHEGEVASSKRHPQPFQLTESSILQSQDQRAAIMGNTNGQNHPYATYNSCNPVSRRDSEIQSMSSGCTDDSTGKRRVRHRITHHDNLPRVCQPRPEVKEKQPIALDSAYIALLEQKVQELFENPPPPIRHEVDFFYCPIKQKQAAFGRGVDNKALTKHLQKLEISQWDGARFVEEPEECQNILDQHISRVFADPITPEFNRSLRNEEIVVDARKVRRGHNYNPAPAHTTAALLKGKSMQTLDSGIGGDKDYRRHKIRQPAPMRWTNKHTELGISDPRSAGWDSGMGPPDRPKSGEVQFRGPSHYHQGGPVQVPIRRHSPPSEDTVGVLFYQDQQDQPFRIKIAKSKLTLGYLKSKVPKKGNYRYLFKLSDANDRSKFIHYEAKRDDEVPPMFNGDCVIVILEPIPPDMSNVV